MWCSCAVTKAGHLSLSLSQSRFNQTVTIFWVLIFIFIFYFLFLFFIFCRSSLDNDNDKTTYGAFLDVDPVHEKLSLRSLVSSFNKNIKI